eukprot:TRINITY_DN12741_c0_g1::TRINITY_DN12741_c0_g1_i1::g.28693::m.28693 TRINITY_DN12741_c0_g1::TRINITY_DN12741_c0_g1_i1::g.28693  ORF type:complete len:523 (+),score=113.08,sp/Q1JPX3/SYFA_DANRE/58.20/0.0,tRNA-synt_2d/PF01409.15/2.8e-91,tRNA-synt_2/PF00152.15/3.5e+02,tRNA-synt_2/PF00152.15/1.4e+03,tRNA-synt_2/PF00152.15/5.7e-05,tRNA-synt_2/PF00152.15/1.5e+02,tRNA-synt_2b/PF00587.20/0.0023,Terpene_synth_C/PF03936.11/0.17 TRINITY_DN12741_c0_g1_i1:62-1570(+)
MTMDDDRIDEIVLTTLDEKQVIDESESFAKERGIDHAVLVERLKSLVAFDKIITTPIPHTVWKATEEGLTYASEGAPEARVFHAIPSEGIQMNDLNQKLPKEIAKIGFSQAMQQKWIRIDKTAGQLVLRSVDSIVDVTKDQLLLLIQKGESSLDAKDLDALKRRKLAAPVTYKTFKIEKGAAFSTSNSKAVADITVAMLQSGSWKAETFKPYNFSAAGLRPAAGNLHPLLKVREEFRQIFLEMGFSEMPTNRFVESSFWNFDTLFQPQQHPARDAHDTFFVSHPAQTPSIPTDYLAKTKEVHERGGYGSLGYRYDWKEEEARKNLLRTHTTAVSSRMLYQMAKDGFRPAKYFSIDRVFRNEALDATHLAEFHQIEGLIADRNLSLADLKGVISQFFTQLGMPKLRFKPAYNPYTEPSMEIFAYHEGLGKYVEIGNSGVFRPEMLRPMGLPEDVSVIAWGLSLERPTMIMYGIRNIRDLFGHKVDLNMIRTNPICRIDKFGSK